METPTLQTLAPPGLRPNSAAWHKRRTTYTPEWCPVQTATLIPPKEGQGCPISPLCLESQGCHLIPLCYLLSCSSAWSCYSLCLIFFFSFFFFACWSVLNFFPENSSIFFVKRKAFLYGSYLAARRSKLVGGIASVHSFYIYIYIYVKYVMSLMDFDVL